MPGTPSTRPIARRCQRDLVRQIEPIHEVVRLLGWPVLEVPGIEADDAIGTLAHVGAASGHRVIISTGDKDLAQLVNDRVMLINTMSNETLDVAGVQAKFGVPPERIVDYLTLVGDAVDNVPGVEQVGPKTAAKWIGEYGSLDGVITAASSIKGAAGDNLRKALDWLPQGKRLITVATDCDLAAHIARWPELDALALREVDRPGLLDFYQRYGFRAWRKELESDLGLAPPPATAAVGRYDESSAPDVPDSSGLRRQYETVLTTERLQTWIQRLNGAALCALDTETDSLDGIRARIVGVSFAVEPGEAAYVPVGHDYPGAPEQLSSDAVLSTLKPWLEDAAAAKVGQNIKYDTHVFANHGIAVQGWCHDTLLESYVLEAHKPHSLESLAERHLNRKGLSYQDLCGKGASQIPFSQVDLARATEYSGEDSEMTLQVHQTLYPRLQREAGLLDVYRDIEMPVSALLARIERHGVLIDVELLSQLSRELAERMVALEQEALRPRRTAFQPGLAEANRRGAVWQARTAGEEEDGQRSTEHR